MLNISAAALVLIPALAFGVAQTPQFQAATSCQPVSGQKIEIGYNPTYSAKSKSFEISAVTLSNINAACTGESLTYSIQDASGKQVGTFTGTITGSALTGDLDHAVSVQDISTVSVIIFKKDETGK